MTYRGTHARGGNVCLTLTPNFSGVTGFVVYNLCGWIQATSSPPDPIVNRSFRTTAGSSFINGSFDGRSAQGTFSVALGGFPPCITGVVNWTATTDATPPWLQTPRPPAQVRCRVPNVIGQKLAAARSRIRARNCRVGRVTRKRSRRVGRVIKQSPRGGVVRARNFKVNLTVGRR